MKTWTSYILAYSLEDALSALASSPGPAHPIAGGTDLLLELQQGRKSPLHTLVDITHIPELKLLEERGDHLFIGAAVPISAIVASPLVNAHALAVAEACNLIGGPQVRNTATLGGNVAHALPAADGMISLVAMDARVEVASQEGRRVVPILEMFRGPGVSALDLSREILVGFQIPFRKQGQASAFSRVMRPQGVALPILNMAVFVEREADQIVQTRIAIGPSGPTPQRALAVEQFLAGKSPTPETLAEARKVLNETVRFRTSPRRATAEYRYQLAGYLLEEVTLKAWQRVEEVIVR
jgi:xanthine dehydrogenase FAD-binding subunit